MFTAALLRHRHLPALMMLPGNKDVSVYPNSISGLLEVSGDNELRIEIFTAVGTKSVFDFCLLIQDMSLTTHPSRLAYIL